MRSTTPSRRDAGACMPARRLLGVLIGGALAQLTADPVRADSGVGTDTIVGNWLLPGGAMRLPARDPEGIAETEVKRNPTGLLNAQPRLVEPRDDGDGWRWRGAVEGGGLKVDGDRDAAKWLEYRDLDGGAIGDLTLDGESGDGRAYLEGSATLAGRDDGFAAVRFGRYNGWRVRAFYSETPHVFTTGYRSLWDGIGSQRMTLSALPAGPTAPATAADTDIAIGEAALAAPQRTLSLVRHKGGIRLDLPYDETLAFFASASSEKREGARPFGMVMGGGGGTGGVETTESVDYDTHEFSAGMQWASERSSANLLLLASLFRNAIDTQSVENPMFVAAANGIASFPSAVFDLAPDNDWLNLKGEFAHAMPELAKSRVTGVVAWSTSRQDDRLIPMTPYAGAVVNGVAGGAWDTTASLSRDSAERRIDTRLFDISWALQPAGGVDLKARWRRHQTDDKSPPYWACNPLTGQWGRLINDGSGAAFAIPSQTANSPPAAPTAYDAAGCDLAAVRALGLVPSAGNVNIGAVRYETRQDVAGVSGDWRVARARSLNLLVERETLRRANRERDRTWEDRVRLGYVDRALPEGTVRLAAEAGRRRGSRYEPDPYAGFYSGSLGPLPQAAGLNVAGWIHTSNLMRKFDLADRDSLKLDARWNQALAETMDLSLALQSRAQRYPHSDYGRGGTHRLDGVNAEWNWQPTTGTALSATVGLQRGRIAQAGLQANACAIGATYYVYSDGSINTTGRLTPAQQAAGITVVGNSGVVTGANFESLCGSVSDFSPLYPSSRRWTVVQKDRTRFAGFGGRHEFGRVRVQADYGYTSGRTGTRYGIDPAALGIVTSGAATPEQLGALALIGAGFPDLRYRQHALDVDLVVPLSQRVWLRALLRHEWTRVADWHYDGVAENPTPAANQQTYLDTGARSYRATAVGVMLGASF